MGGVLLIRHHLVCIWSAAWPLGMQSECAYPSEEVNQQDVSQEQILISNGQVVEAKAEHQDKMESLLQFCTFQTHQLAAANLSEDRGQSSVQR